MNKEIKQIITKELKKDMETAGKMLIIIAIITTLFFIAAMVTRIILFFELTIIYLICLIGTLIVQQNKVTRLLILNKKEYLKINKEASVTRKIKEIIKK